VLLDERLTVIQTGGGGLVLVAVFLTNLPAGAIRKKRKS
jgi:drug/metabolite transporter (DMT)-like permease